MKRLRKNKIYQLIAIVVIAASIVGCTGGEQETASPVTSTEAVVSESTSSVPDETNGMITDTTIRIYVSGSPELDPAVGNMALSIQAYANLYDQLIFSPADGSIQPRLAERWESDETGQTHTFKLREGVKFHDGSEVTAEDVKFSMERFITIGEGYSYVFKDVVDTVEAPSKYEVVSNLKYLFSVKKDEIFVITADTESDPYVVDATAGAIFSAGGKPMVIWLPTPPGVSKAADPGHPLESLTGALLNVDCWVEFNNKWLL